MSNIINPITVNDEALKEVLTLIVEDLLPDLVAREVAKLNHPSNGEPDPEPYVFKVGDRVRLETNDEAKWGLEAGGTYVLGPNPGFICGTDGRLAHPWADIREGREVVLRELYLGGAKGTFEANVATNSGFYVDPSDLIRPPETVWIHAHDYQGLPAFGPDRWVGEDIHFPLVGDFYQVKQVSVEKLGEFKPSGRKPKAGDRIRLLVDHPNRQYPAAPAGVTATVRTADDPWYNGKIAIEHDLVDGREAPYYGANLLARDEFTILVTS